MVEQITPYHTHSRDDRYIDNTVYLVIGQDRAGQWYEVAQTSGTRTVIQGTMTAKLNQLKVLAVRKDGVKATSTIMTDGTNCEEMERIRIKTETERNREIINLSLRPTLEIFPSEKIFSAATLTWKEEPFLNHPGSSGSRYLVQWRDLPYNNKVIGTLHTSSNTVRLRLQPNKLYVVEIHDLWARRVSPPTIINTTVRENGGVSWELVIVLGSIPLAVLVLGAILINMICTKEHIHRYKASNVGNIEKQTGYVPCTKELDGEENLSSTLVNSQEVTDKKLRDLTLSMGVSNFMTGFKQSLNSVSLTEGSKSKSKSHLQDI